MLKTASALASLAAFALLMPAFYTPAHAQTAADLCRASATNLGNLAAADARAPESAPENSPAGLKAAAIERATRLAPGVPIIAAEIRRVMGDFGVVRLYPPPGLTDPAIVFVRRERGRWTGVAGPGTAFAPGDVPGVPDAVLRGFDTPYSRMTRDEAFDRVGRSTRTYDAPGLTFQYPANATLSGSGVSGSPIRLIGPVLPSSAAGGPAYEFQISPLAVAPSEPLDEWGYERYAAETPRQTGPTLDTMTFFRNDVSNIVQIDRYGGPSVLREFYIEAANGDGCLAQVRTLLFPLPDDPAAVQQNATSIILLETLRYAISAP